MSVWDKTPRACGGAEGDATVAHSTDRGEARWQGSPVASPSAPPQARDADGLSHRPGSGQESTKCWANWVGPMDHDASRDRGDRRLTGGIRRITINAVSCENRKLIGNEKEPRAVFLRFAGRF